MALVSPGIQLTVTDQSQYIPAAVGTVPLVVLATAQDKVVNGSTASGTIKSAAGTLQVFGSQRELVTALGYPAFQQSSAGTPLHGNELNEYGLMSAYSALGLGNQLYAVRADIDLNQLTSTAVRPTGSVTDGTYWLDLANTAWGIYEWSADTQSFTEKTPIVITSASNTTTSNVNCIPTPGVSYTLTNEPTPSSNIGQIGSYAVVTTTVNNRVFKKGTDNTWKLVGSQEWQNNTPTLVSTVTNPTTTGTVLTINRVNVAVASGANVTTIAANINLASITGVTASNVAGKLNIYVNGLSRSNGSTADANVRIGNDTGATVTTQQTLATELGLTASIYAAPDIVYGNYANVPPFYTGSINASPNGSVWAKSGALGGGNNFVIRRYNELTETWTAQAVTSYTSEFTAITTLDPAGGSNIPLGTVFVREDPLTVDTTTSQSLGVASFRPYVRTVYGAVTATGSTPAVQAGTFQITTNQPTTSTSTYYVYTVTVPTIVTATGASEFVSAVLAANIPNITAQVNSNGTISLTHQAGGTIKLGKNSGQPNIPYLAGFTNGTKHVRVTLNGTDSNTSVRYITGFDALSYTYSLTQPTADPVDGRLWYYGDATVLDIMVNDGTAWRGYQNVSLDARGYNLAATNSVGAIVSASRPTTQDNGNALASGDIWLDTSDLENWPKLSRYNGTAWVALDNTDQISQNGVVFADARWDDTGTTDPVTGNLPSISTLLTSNYVDLDAPNPALYPRGMLLVNTRRSGYNVKQYLGNYFNTGSYTPATYSSTTTYSAGSKVQYGTAIYVALQTTTGNTPTNVTYWSTLMTSSWVTASGLKNDGSPYAGRKAQRQMVVAAMQSAIDSNTQIREDQFNFSLICAPGYPELIDNMVALNNDRANTGFVIGDTPMTLSTSVVELTNWSNDADGTGLATNDPYLGVYYPSGLSNDANGNTIMVPPSHMALRAFLHSDNVSYPWFAPAGTRRGLVDNASDIGYLNPKTGEFVRTGVNQALRDSLYSININPITIITGIGLVVWGQKTRNPISSALDRINVARLVNYIRKVLAKSGDAFLFEPNDKITRDQFAAIINSAMNDLVAKRGIYDYLVVCDTSNNTPDRIARNELYVDIAIEPMKDVEFIYIPIRLLNPGSIKSGNLGNQTKA